MGSDRCARNSRSCQTCFNPRSRMGSDRSIRRVPHRTLQFQPTLPHGERRKGGWFVRSCPKVSTHAPAWGATVAPSIVLSKALGVSTHAPAWGATLNRDVEGYIDWFQPTLPHGERRCNRRRTANKRHGFNPRSRMGSDTRRNARFICFIKFQPTLPHGERLQKGDSCPKRTRFNPRSRMGSDDTFFKLDMMHICFNPRSRMGSDVILLCSECYIFLVSTHAPAWGATY